MRETKKASEEEIGVRAYELYVQRDGSEGNAVEDWLRAENELNEKLAGKAESGATEGKPFTEAEKVNVAKAGGGASS